MLDSSADDDLARRSAPHDEQLAVPVRYYTLGTRTHSTAVVASRWAAPVADRGIRPAVRDAAARPGWRSGSGAAGGNAERGDPDSWRA